MTTRSKPSPTTYENAASQNLDAGLSCIFRHHHVSVSDSRMQTIIVSNGQVMADTRLHTNTVCSDHAT